MAAVAVERVGGVLRATFRVPEGTEVPVWWRATVARYASESGATIPAEVEAAWLCEAAAVTDRLIDPALARSVPPSAGVKLPARVFGARGSLTRGEVSALTTVAGRTWAEVRAAAVADPASASAEVLREVTRVEMMLAQVSIMREVVSGARSRAVTVGTAAGELFTVLAVGSVIVLGIALDEYFDAVRNADALRSAADERVARARIAQAAQDFRARLEALRTTGTMPPPSALETAAAADVQRRAQSEWDNFWRGAAGAAQGIGKGAIFAAVAALLLLGGSSRR